MSITLRSAQTISNGVTLRGNNTQYIAPPPTLPLLFELDASIYASGTTLLDISGNDHHATIAGGPAWDSEAGGCFVFDAYIQSDFPNSPPLISHATSRINKFRFNPNLYDCGKVCLSLLGTWSGSESEKWLPPNKDGSGSTLFQVIMSIYSMVFSEDPWFNEPGRERGIGDASNNKQAIEYNQNIREGTIKYAIMNQLKYPENGFEDVIKTHFKLRKDDVSAYLKEQDADFKQFESLLE